MRIIISPAKKMRHNEDMLDYIHLPVFLSDAKELLHRMQTLTLEQLKEIWDCNDKIAKESFERVSHMDLEKNLTPALLSYEGIQYQYMRPAVFERDMLTYVEENLRILSGFYGVLKPMDGVTPYRLELESNVSAFLDQTLYDYWGKKVYEEVMDESGILVNLASKQYFKLFEKYKEQKDLFIHCIFGELKEGRVVQKGTYAKMARGEMVHYMAKHKVKDLEELKGFKALGYSYSEKYSSATEFVFLKEKHDFE